MSAGGRPAALLASLGALERNSARQRFFARRPELVSGELVDVLCTEVSRLFGVDLEQAGRMASTARWLARRLGDEERRARSLRAAANAQHFAGRSARAQKLYAAALACFQQVEDEGEAAITRSSALLNLAYLGDYETAFAWAEAARQVFARLGDALRLAILEHNLANVLFRQDRWPEALAAYQRAQQAFQELDRAHDAAICQRNIAVCHISRHDFAAALAAYEATRAYCVAHGLGRIVLQVDYAVAYLHYLRGEYSRAIQLFHTARRAAEAEGDTYHSALCDLDEAELYLELNRVQEAAELAADAMARFETLGMPYETAKAMTTRAIATSRLGQSAAGLKLLEAARRIFVDEKNRLWPAHLDLYRAVVHYRAGRVAAAFTLARAARRTFGRLALASQAATCDLLLAELHLETDAPRRALARCRGALAHLARTPLPALSHQAYLVLGEVEERRGAQQRAIAAYRRSQHYLEKLRSQLRGESLKLSFLADKHAVYESLVWLTVQQEPSAARNAAALQTIETAKSRGLADLLAFRVADLPSRAARASGLDQRVRALREELRWLYRRLDHRTLEENAAATAPDVVALRRRLARTEEALLRAQRDLEVEDPELGSLQHGATADLGAIRAALPPDACLLAYFIARDTLFACAVDASGLEIVTLGPASPLHARCRQLRLQIGRQQRATATAEALITAATTAHLQALGAALIAPLASHLRRHLIIVPHGFLHYVPFHALLHEGAALIEGHTLSYAPSATVYQLCAGKEAHWEERSLVLGVADARAPQIRQEVETVAAALPAATLLRGVEASEDALRQQGAGCRYLHLATHGIYRQDNPMFSALQLGTSRLGLFDLYSLRLDAELAVLSGCGTGLSNVLGGEELVGLVRGLLYAGCHGVLVSLWDVHDATTATFMGDFYRHLAAGTSPAQALQCAMTTLRENHPHPYYWAPFVLIGKAGVYFSPPCPSLYKQGLDKQGHASGDSPSPGR